MADFNQNLQLLSKNYALDLGRPLEAIDIEMIQKYGIPLNSNQWSHYQRHGDLAAVEKDIRQTVTTAEKNWNKRQGDVAHYQQLIDSGNTSTMSEYEWTEYYDDKAQLDKEMQQLDALKQLQSYGANVSQAVEPGQYSLSDLNTLEMESPGSLTQGPDAIRSGLTRGVTDRQGIDSYEYGQGDTGESGYAVSQRMNEVTDQQFQDAQAALQANPNGFTSQRDQNIIANYELQRGMQQRQPGTVDRYGGETPGMRDPLSPEGQAAQAAGQAGQPGADGAAGAPGATGAVGASQSTLSALQQLENDPYFQGLSDDLKSLYRQVVGEWNVGEEINMEGVLGKFQDIQANTIDPYFSQQVMAPFIADVTEQYNQLQIDRDRELEIERTTSGENIKQAKSDLEKSGMTFTGKGIEDLGAQAAIGQPGSPDSAIPSQDPFATEGGSNYFYEGTVNQANRLMSTGSSERYRRSLQQLGRSAEGQIGSEAAGGLGIAYNPVGGLTGSIEEQRQQQLASTLSSLAGQNRQNVEQDAPLNYQF